MQEETKSLEELFSRLPPEDRQEVLSHIERLIARQEIRASRQPQFDWAGALEGLRDQYSSVNLQHQITDWRSTPE